MSRYLTRASKGCLTNLEQLDALSDQELKKIIFPERCGAKDSVRPDFSRIHQEMKRKHVTLKLLWEEEFEKNPDILKYSHFCTLYRAWKKDQKLSMKQAHKAGEKAFIDYAGSTVPVIIDTRSGETRDAKIFVMTLGASNYTYFDATWTESTEDFVSSTIRGFEFFGGVPKALVPDNLKSAVTVSSRYEPEINRTYREMASYYQTAVLPARVRAPKDKGSVENAVGNISRQILAKVRDRKFFTLSELNEYLKEMRVEYNDRKMQGFSYSRREFFEQIDKEALTPLPVKRLEEGLWKEVRANIDYHIILEKCFYSVPWKLRREKLSVRYTNREVEIFHEHTRVACHLRLHGERKVSTVKAHMPRCHQAYSDQSPSHMIRQARSIGACCGQLCQKILEQGKHPEQVYRTCMGIIRLGKSYPP